MWNNKNKINRKQFYMREIIIDIQTFPIFQLINYFTKITIRHNHRKPFKVIRRFSWISLLDLMFMRRAVELENAM